MKILIIRFSSIGDIVLTTPVIRCIKQQLPGAEIHYLTKPQFKDLVANNPYVSRVHVLTDNFSQMTADLKAEKFDHIIDLHHNLRTLRLQFALQKKFHRFDKLNFKKWLLVNFKINTLPNVHIVERYLKTVEFLGVKNDGEGLDYFIPEKDELTTLNGFSLKQPYVAFVIGATHFTKRMPDEKISSLCSKINLPVFLIGGKAEEKNGEAIAAEGGNHVHNTCGKLNLNQSASLVKQAAYVISHDTGLMHIAAAFKQPVISLWGNTIPEFGMYPYYGNHNVKNLISEVAGLPCRPCSKIGSSQCPKGHFDCMKKQNEEAILQFIQV
ncbi:MAG: glycosyltransferase family 9 protein [Bacteroidia bacterium]|nr:glycosyltransferase family 9 protein [Bacteroidia bacterium]